MSWFVDWELAERIADAAAGEGPARCQAPGVDLGTGRARAELAAYTGADARRRVPGGGVGEPPRVGTDQPRLDARAARAASRTGSQDLGPGRAGEMLERSPAEPSPCSSAASLDLPPAGCSANTRPPLAGSREPRLIFVGQNIETAAAEPRRRPRRRPRLGRPPRGHSRRPLRRCALAGRPPRRPRRAAPRGDAGGSIAGGRARGRRGRRDPEAWIAQIRESDPSACSRRPRRAGRSPPCRRPWPLSRATPSTSWTRRTASSARGSRSCAPGWSGGRGSRPAGSALAWLLGFEMKLRQYGRQAVRGRGRGRRGNHWPEPSLERSQTRSRI